jgi:DNA-binding XRE family transcriptional regulator
MRSVQDGTVYLALDEDFFDERAGEGFWFGSCQFPDGTFEEGPTFADAKDAVSWWKARGATAIAIRLDSHEYLWAGEGRSPEGPNSMQDFDPEDPRGRPEGARETITTQRRANAQQDRAEQEANAIDQGERLSRRRESVGLTVEQLAKRVGETPTWLLDIESGQSTRNVNLSQWTTLVWATRPGWPDEMNNVERRRVGWVVRNGQYLDEAEEIVNRMLGLEGDRPS